MPQDAPADPNYNRCSWFSYGDRCAYLARWFPGNPQSGKGLCWEHFRAKDDEEKRAIVTRSHRDIAIDADYSTKALVEAATKAYEARKQRTPAEPAKEAA